MNVAIPDHLEPYVYEQLQAGGYESANQFIEALIEADRKVRQSLKAYASHPRAEELVLEGLASGDPKPMSAADWQNIRDEVRRRCMERQQP